MKQALILVVIGTGYIARQMTYGHIFFLMKNEVQLRQKPLAYYQNLQESSVMTIGNHTIPMSVLIHCVMRIT
jgi:hypothetical protein